MDSWGRRDALVNAASSRQPPPGGGGQAVFDVAIRFVGFDPDLIDALHARSEKGAAKYAQPLRTRDGRNSRHEQLQKALDGFVYAVKDHIEGPGSLMVVAAWLRVLLEVAARVSSAGEHAPAWTIATAKPYLLRMGMTELEAAIALHRVGQ